MTTLKREKGSRQFMKVACQVAELLPMLPMLPMGKVRVRETQPGVNVSLCLAALPSDWGHSAAGGKGRGIETTLAQQTMLVSS